MPVLVTQCNGALTFQLTCSSFVPFLLFRCLLDLANIITSLSCVTIDPFQCRLSFSLSLAFSPAVLFHSFTHLLTYLIYLCSSSTSSSVAIDFRAVMQSAESVCLHSRPLLFGCNAYTNTKHSSISLSMASSLNTYLPVHTFQKGKGKESSRRH